MKKIERTEVNELLNIVSTKNTSNITIKEENGIYCETFYFDDIYDEKKVKQFIKAVESVVRRSSYYSEYIGKINELGITNCALLGNVSKNSETKVEVEMHHFPWTLYDIVQIHLNKAISNERKFTTFSLANDIIRDHYNNIIPLVPLCKTAHQLVHTGDAAISVKQVFGDIHEFINKYEEYMTDEMIIKYNKIIEYSENSDLLYESNNILEVEDLGLDTGYKEIEF